MTQLEQDIEVALKLLYKEPLTQYEKSHYDYLYPHTNEGINYYYNHTDLTKKKALTITASGDHPIYASLAGATEIDSIDINGLAKYYSELKIAAILAYNKEQFYKMFNIELPTLTLINPNFKLDELKPFLEPAYFTFWQEITKTEAFKKNSRLFINDYSPLQFPIPYEKVQDHLHNTKINYYDISYDEYTKICKKKYDAIFLSNIAEWDNTITYANKGYTILNKDGVIYDYHINRPLIIPQSNDNFKTIEAITCEKKEPNSYKTEESYKGVLVYKKV